MENLLFYGVPKLGQITTLLQCAQILGHLITIIFHLGQMEK